MGHIGGMSMAALAALATEYLRYQVTATVAGAVYTPTSDVVQFAFPVTGAQPSTWLSGSWETVGSNYFARVLVGPTGGVVTLTAGTTYDVWMKITDSPEIPVRLVGKLTVY
jgi:hypothetical protein